MAASEEDIKQYQLAIKTATAMLSRADMQRRMGFQFEGERDLYAVLGYKGTLQFEDYLVAYERGDIAQRIIEAPVISTWRHKPVISNDSEADTFTEFESAWAALCTQLKVYHYLERADKLAGIGQYGILLIGTKDIRKESDMAIPMAKLKGPQDVVYLRPFMQGSAPIEKYDTNPASPRFGLPELYKVSILSGNNVGTSSQKTVLVHHSRVLHIAEGLLENDFLGIPRLRAVYNKLDDLAKISGGSAEIFWQAAKRIIVLQAKEGFTPDDSDDQLTAQMEELIHGIRRAIDVQGFDVKTLDPTDVKPDEAFRVALALISSATGIPQRILLGSEQGKMASEQDEVNWNGKMRDRQTNYAEPSILRPFIDKLVLAGALPVPDQSYTVTWPSLFELSDKERAQIGLLLARAVATYCGKAGESLPATSQIVTPEEFRRIHGLRSVKVEIQSVAPPKDDNNDAPDSEGAI